MSWRLGRFTARCKLSGLPPIPVRPMAGHVTLNHVIEVRVLGGELARSHENDETQRSAASSSKDP